MNLDSSSNASVKEEPEYCKLQLNILHITNYVPSSITMPEVEAYVNKHTQ